MAIESVDLLKLLNRARKAIPDPFVSGENEPKVQDAAVDRVPEAVAALAAVQFEPQPVPEPAAAAVVPDHSSTDEDLASLENELQADEKLLRRILGMLYRSKKENPNGGAVSILAMEKILGLEREGAAFVMMYMKTKKVIEMDDKSRMSITVCGIDYLRDVFALRGDGPIGQDVEDQADSTG